jgi:hypothetical protein
MLDILDKNGKVVAVVMDDGTVIKKISPDDDINRLVKEQLEKTKKGK